MTSSLCVSVAIGSLGLLTFGGDKAKSGVVNISETEINKFIAEVGLVPFFPVSLKSQNLKRYLFNESKSFTDITQGK